MVAAITLKDLINADDPDLWSQRLFELANLYGYEQVFYSLLPNRSLPVDEGFLCSNCLKQWRNIYDQEIYPMLLKDQDSTTPLILILGAPNETQLCLLHEDMKYLNFCSLFASVTFPIYGPNGVFGVMSFVTKASSGRLFQQQLNRSVSDLALIRDYVFQSSLRFLRKFDKSRTANLTKREIECLQWVMEGKSTWEISSILSCSESTVNFHITNVREKFKVRTRQQAVVKAINQGLLMPN